MKKNKKISFKTIAATFDPTGLLTPITLAGKIFVQKLWKEKCGWDEVLPENFATEWHEILRNYEQIGTFDVNRLIPHTNKQTKHQLIAFVDASNHAYACAIYLRTECENSSVTCELVFAKSRLAPMKDVSIPRLELMSMLIGVRALKFVENSIHLQTKKYVCTDSGTYRISFCFDKRKFCGFCDKTTIKCRT